MRISSSSANPFGIVSDFLGKRSSGGVPLPIHPLSKFISVIAEQRSAFSRSR
ncbi:hypothetical protein D3C79_1075360 [compost metagenome]